MVDGEDAVGKKVIESRIHQEGQRAAVDQHAIRLTHGNGTDCGFHDDRAGKLAQLTIDDRADNGWVLPFGKRLQE
jgi:hypothetical protein